WQRLGVHVTRNHFYHPIPDTGALGDELFDRPSDMVGVDLGALRQEQMLRRFAAKYRGEYDQFPEERTGVAHQYFRKNGLFAGVDAEVLYCMAREFKPRRIYEIGSGNSTYVSAQ